MAYQIQQRRDTAANWTSANPILAIGEFGYETDTGKIKVGDGATAWASLAYYRAIPAPAGTDTQVQYNDGGALNGSADMVFDKATGKLTVKKFEDTTSGLVTAAAASTTGTRHLAPRTDNTYDFGRADALYRDMYLKGSLKEGANAVTVAQARTAYDHSQVSHMALDTNGHIAGEKKPLIFTISDPLSVQTKDNEICLWDSTDAAFTITKISVTLDASTNQVAGDLKYADTFIGLANPVVINDFDTTSGVRSDTTIATGAVPAGKCLYLAFDSAPNAAIKQMNVAIYYDYD